MSVISVWYKCPKCGEKLKMRQDTYYLFDEPNCSFCKTKMQEIEREQDRFQEEPEDIPDDEKNFYRKGGYER